MRDFRKFTAGLIGIYETDADDISEVGLNEGETVRFDALNMMFKHVEYMVVKDVKQDTKTYWKRLAGILQKINELLFSKLKEIELRI